MTTGDFPVGVERVDGGPLPAARRDLWVRLPRGRPPAIRWVIAGRYIACE